MTTQSSQIVASQIARLLGSYNCFVGSIKYISTNLQGVRMLIVYMFMLIF
jgi:hypothetical protein